MARLTPTRACAGMDLYIYACAHRSAALLKMGKLEAALDDADAALKCNPMYAKGYLRKGQALSVM